MWGEGGKRAWVGAVRGWGRCEGGEGGEGGGGGEGAEGGGGGWRGWLCRASKKYYFLFSFV